jgi:hypothetical protein
VAVEERLIQIGLTSVILLITPVCKQEVMVETLQSHPIGQDSVVTGTVIVDKVILRLVLVLLHSLELVIKPIVPTVGCAVVAGRLHMVLVVKVQ